METANFQSLIKTVFWIFIIYYVVKFLSRLFLPVLAKKVVQKASEQFQKQQQEFNNANSTNESNVKKTKTFESKKVGEYVDFEEIETENPNKKN